MDRKQFLSALEFGSAMNPFASPEENDAQMKVVQQRQQARAAQAEANDVIASYQKKFAQMKAQYDKLSEGYDYMVADRDAAHHVIRELRTAAGIPKEEIGERLEAYRNAALSQK